MFHKDASSALRTNVQIGNNGVKHHHHNQQKQQNQINNSIINQTTTTSCNNRQTKSPFSKLFSNPFSNSKSKSQTIKSDSVAKENSDSDQYKKSVKVLKQFWNDQIKTAKSSEHLNRKSETIKYFSQSNDSLNELKPQLQINRAEKSLTLDGSCRLPLDDFNKFKDANFIRNKKIKLQGGGSQQLESSVTLAKRFSKPESYSINDNHFPQISATGGKIHWAKRDELFTKKSQAEAAASIGDNIINMSVKTNKVNASNSNSSNSNSNNGKTIESTENQINKSKSINKETTTKNVRSDSMTSSVASSINSNISSTTNSASSRKFSFKTNPATTSSYMNKKLSAGGSGSCSKVAQIAQRFNQMIQQDATILDEVKKRGSLVVHRSGGRVFKIKEEKANDKGNACHSKKSPNDESNSADDAISLLSVGKNSTRRKSSIKKRPSIRILVESPRKDGNGNVLSKRQLYETNVVNKETIVIKPKVPDKSERVIAKTKELKSKKMLNEIIKTEKIKNEANINEATHASKKELNNVSSGNTLCYVNKEQDDQLPKIDEIVEPIKDIGTSKNNLRKIYDKITFRPTFLYGKKTTNSKSSTMETSPLPKSTQFEAAANMVEGNFSEKEEDEETMTREEVETHKATCDNVTNEIEDEFELQPIDLNLNVYFNNENLSNISANTTAIEMAEEEDKNVSSQGPNPKISNDVTVIANSKNKPDKQPVIDMKPNESFLFRIQSSTKFDIACDTFIRSMLNENNSSFNDVENADDDEINLPSKINLLSSSLLSCDNADDDDDVSVKCNVTINADQENDYEIISRDLHENSNGMKLAEKKESGDIDNNNDGGDNVIRQKKAEVNAKEEENIYQSLSEVKGNGNSNNDAISVKSYESFEDYDEIKQNILDNKINLSDILRIEDDYIFPSHNEIPPELPAPRKTIPKISSPILTSTTSNLVQANLPKRNASYELQKSNSCTSTTYEKIKYDQLPHSKHQHSHNQINVTAQLPLPPRNNHNKHQQQHQQKQQQQHDENIYDTIKGSNACDNRSSTEYEKIQDIDNDNSDNNKAKIIRKEEYENICDSFDMSDDGDNPYKNSKNDTMSIISNCYESISLKQSYSTINQILRHAISTTTLNSEHRINSIYGIGQSLTPPSDRSGSDNSDEWIDVESEDEEAENNDRFIV